MFLFREVEMPSIIVLNMTIDGYCLPESKIETIEDLLRFLNSVLDGSAKVCGGRYFPVRLFCHAPVKYIEPLLIKFLFSPISYSEEIDFCSTLNKFLIKQGLLWW